MEAARLIEGAIREGAFPGACAAYGRDRTFWRGAFGRTTYCPDDPPVALESLWDLASVSKVVGTTTMAMILFEEGKLDLDRPAAQILPSFGQNGKETITPRHLLLHEAGLIAFRPYHRTLTTRQEVEAAIDAEALTYPIGTKSIYSDLSMIVLARAMEAVSGQSLDSFLAERVFQPLRMSNATYRPEPARCVPTEAIEPWRASLRETRQTHFPSAVWIQGEVHDPTATVLGGVAGHAGLFASLDDLERFAQFLLKGGIVSRETLRLFTTRGSDRSSRALGWDTKSPEGSSAGTRFGPRSFGHTGYTGTSLWVDPDEGFWAILLTNRVHPTAANTKLLAFRPVFHDAVFPKD